MQSDRLLSISGGVSFFVLLAIFPAITALVSTYGLLFSPSTITANLSILNEFVPDNVLGIVREQANRIAYNHSSALSLGIILGILVSLWSAMSGVKAMIDALNVIYEQKESRSFIKLNLVALAFTLAGFAAAHRFPDRFWQFFRDAYTYRPLAGIACSVVDWSGSPLPLRS
jgi:membrane protein